MNIKEKQKEIEQKILENLEKINLKYIKAFDKTNDAKIKGLDSIVEKVEIETKKISDFKVDAKLIFDNYKKDLNDLLQEQEEEISKFKNIVNKLEMQIKGMVNLTIRNKKFLKKYNHKKYILTDSD